MRTTITDKKQLIKQYHTICSKMGISDEHRKSIMHGYGVESSTELNETQLLEIIDKLNNDGNKWRKRVIAAISAWLKDSNKQVTMELIKSIARRASKCDDFNKISVTKLRAIYNAFTIEKETNEMVRLIKAEGIAKLQYFN